MPAPQVHLDSVDATELAEMLTFIDQWLTGPDHAQLTASLRRFVGIDGYNLTQLRTDLARVHLPARPRRRRTVLRHRQLLAPVLAD
jgi:hypothetical protein